MLVPRAQVSVRKPWSSSLGYLAEVGKQGEVRILQSQVESKRNAGLPGDEWVTLRVHRAEDLHPVRPRLEYAAMVSEEPLRGRRRLDLKVKAATVGIIGMGQIHNENGEKPHGEIPRIFSVLVGIVTASSSLNTTIFTL